MNEQFELMQTDNPPDSVKHPRELNFADEWNKVVAKVRKDVLVALKPLEADYGFNVEKAVIREDNQYPEVVARNAYTFLEVLWSPHDGLEYDIGPLVRGKIPEECEIEVSGGRVKLTGYEIVWFSKLSETPLPKVRGNGASTAKAARNAIEFLIVHASKFLRGDWSQRPQLDEMVAGHRKRNQL
jgi:hypothetical protein